MRIILAAALGKMMLVKAILGNHRDAANSGAVR
jgi:hypothetical protein